MAVSMNGDHLAAALGAFEPQRQSNWLLLVHLANSTDSENIKLSLESFNAPNVGVEPISLNYLNIVRRVAGKAAYDTAPLVVKDMVDVGVAAAIDRWHKTVYDPVTDNVGLAKMYKKQADLLMVSPNGQYQRTWILFGVWPVAVNYGTLDMSSGNPVMIEVTLSYDKAVGVLTPGKFPIGIVVDAAQQILGI